MSDTLALIVGLVLTLFIYSYLVGDNPLFRIAVHLMVGVSAGYAGVIAVRRLLLPAVTQVLLDPTAPESGLWVVPIALSLLLLFKWVGPVSWLGNTSLGILVAIGAAAALFGAIAGTLVPQLVSFQAGTPLSSLAVAVLTACSLLYFQFTGKGSSEDAQNQPSWRRGWIGPAATLGQIVLMVTFGAVFAGVFTTSLILLVERVDYFITGLSSFFGVILL